LAFTLRTGAAAAAGSIVVILRHEPLKSAGVASGSITNAVEQQMHRLPMPFRLNSILVKNELNEKRYSKVALF
jgi:hypothetical protein